MQIIINNPLVPPRLRFAFLLLLCRVIDTTKAKEIKGSPGAPSEAEKDAYELLRTLVRGKAPKLSGQMGRPPRFYILPLCLPCVRCFSLLLSVDGETG